MLKHRLISPAEYVQMPWKNGQGTTTQIAIFPEDARFSENSFLWRISSAKILQKNSFSQFPGYDRLLTVWEGRGLKLNDMLLEPLQIHAFSGEDTVICEPVSNEVIDLGVIYDRNRCRVKFEVISSLQAQESHQLEFQDGTHFVICAEGSFLLDQLTLAKNHTLRFDGSGNLTLTAQHAFSSCFLISIRLL